MIQERYVVPQHDFDEMKSTVNQLVRDKKTKKADQFKKEWEKNIPGDYITTESPIYKAMETGILVLPKEQGGSHDIKVEKI